jgi:hypothetical protein
MGATLPTFTPSHGDSEPAHIDPAAVATLVESRRRRAGAPVPVALVTLSTGQEFTVEDPGRDVARRIWEARGERVDS